MRGNEENFLRNCRNIVSEKEKKQAGTPRRRQGKALTCFFVRC